MEDLEPKPAIFCNQAASGGYTGIPTQPQNLLSTIDSQPTIKQRESSNWSLLWVLLLGAHGTLWKWGELWESEGLRTLGEHGLQN